jgi:putative secretion ATPase (PEP-CTERM system associated)
MYERFYQLRERPFALSPDPDYLYPSRVHREALSYLRYGIEGHAGFVVITGEIGSGKTTLLQTLLRGLDRETTVARLMNTMLAPHELLEAILIDFGLPVSESKPLMLRTLADFLVQERAAGRLVLLVIDEAQNLSAPALEEVRMLSNLETEKSKLIQIVLVGQPDLREALGSPDLEQLRQRITVSYHLLPLDAPDTASYINHRLRRAAVGAPLEFPVGVCDLVHARSGGVPRIINVICDAVLLFGYGDERRVIDEPLAAEAIAELEATGVLAPPGRSSTAVNTSGVAPAGAVASAAVAGAAMTAAPPQPSTAPVRIPPAEPTPATSRAVSSEEDPVLRARERQIEQREQQLAAQRRVLEEEYRLLRAAGSGPSPAPAAPWPPVAAYPRPPVVTAPAAARPQGAAAPFPPRRLDTRDTLWGRVRRVFSGLSAPLNERS